MVRIALSRRVIFVEYTIFWQNSRESTYLRIMSKKRSEKKADKISRKKRSEKVGKGRIPTHGFGKKVIEIWTNLWILPREEVCET